MKYNPYEEDAWLTFAYNLSQYPFSTRECELLWILFHEKTSPDMIARELGVHRSTIKSKLMSISYKMGQNPRSSDRMLIILHLLGKGRPAY